MKRKRNAFSLLIAQLRELAPHVLAVLWIVGMSAFAIFTLSIWL